MSVQHRSISLIAHNLRSCHNVGSLLRTAEGLGISHVYLTGHTPYPAHAGDTRLPHLAAKIERQIQKTALGSHNMVPWSYHAEISTVLDTLGQTGTLLAAIEQSTGSTLLPDFQPPDRVALLIGREVEGIEPEILALADTVVEIPMFGQKESFNVVQAAAMAMYHCRFST